MRWKSEHKHQKNWRFIIQQEDLYDVIEKTPLVEFCLYVFENPNDFQDDLQGNDCVSFQDKYCQDDLQTSQKQALEDFGIPLDSWVQVA